MGQVVDAREQDEEKGAGRRRREGRVRSVSGITRMANVTRASAALLQADCAWYGVPTGQFLMRAEASPKSKLSTAVSPASEKTVSAAKVRK